MVSWSKIIFILTAMSFFSACNRIENSQYYEYLSTTAEQPECLKHYSYASTISINGTAKFFKRGVNLVTQYNSTTNKTELKNITLGNPLVSALPIKYAEVVVYNSKKEIVQCGRTDSSGVLRAIDASSNLTIPAIADSYTVQVLSRAYVQFASVPGKNPFFLNASIKKDKYTNKLYALEKSSSTNGVDDLSFEFLAYARQTESNEINGGAFNILNSIYSSYLYISANTGTRDTQCLSDKVHVYWKAGFNPFQYLYPTANPESLGSNSYYDQHGDKGLYITGGLLGDTLMVNTDHFDDFVVIHELGHLIEDRCGQLTSPGGNHYLISRIDPRLAWTESWANYLAGHVMYNYISQINPEFEDKMFNAGFTIDPTDKKWAFFSSTIGLSDSELSIGNGSGVMFDLKKPGSNPDVWQDGAFEGRSFDKVDPLRYLGEGHFREGAITRGLFKLTNACGTNCATSPVSFETVWRAMSKSEGVGALANKFKSAHDVFEAIKTFISGVVWSADKQAKMESEALHLYSDSHYLAGSDILWVPYGKKLTTLQGSACSLAYHIEPRSDDPLLTATNSDQRYSNHFYTIDFSTMPSVSEITVNFTKTELTGTNTEFDLILFKEDYFFNGDYSCSSLDEFGNCGTSWQPSRTVTEDVVRYDRRSGASLFSKKIKDLRALDNTKKYLLNIRAYTAGRTISSTTKYKYEIRDQGGNYICP